MICAIHTRRHSGFTLYKLHFSKFQLFLEDPELRLRKEHPLHLHSDEQSTQRRARCKGKRWVKEDHQALLSKVYICITAHFFSISIIHSYQVNEGVHSTKRSSSLLIRSTSMYCNFFFDVAVITIACPLNKPMF